MSKRNNYIVHIFISSKKSLEEVEKRTLDRMKFNWRKNSAVSWITQVPDSYADEDDCANAAERALARIGRAKDGAKEVQKLYPGDRPDGTVAGLELAEKFITEELARYHGE